MVRFKGIIMLQQETEPRTWSSFRIPWDHGMGWDENLLTYSNTFRAGKGSSVHLVQAGVHLKINFPVNSPGELIARVNMCNMSNFTISLFHFNMYRRPFSYRNTH